MRLPIYLDYNATTPVPKEVVDKMEPYFTDYFGNPSSGHIYGDLAKKALAEARNKVANLINSSPDEIIFTSGGTESNNMVIKSLIFRKDLSKCHIITSAIEHPSILNPLLKLMEFGLKVTVLPVNNECLIDPDQVLKAIQKDTVLVSIMLANNETGVIQPIKEISKITKERGIFFHTDAAQAVGKIQVDVKELGVDLLTIAGHKLYAPKGIGGLYIRSGVALPPIMEGGGQEMGLRPGTENVPYCVALGEAAELSKLALSDKEPERIKALRDRFYDRVKDQIHSLVLNGHHTLRLPNTLSISIPGVRAAELLSKVSDIFVASTGAACHDRSVSISHVLASMGVPEEVALGTIRISLGRYTTEEECDIASESLIRAAYQLMAK